MRSASHAFRRDTGIAAGLDWTRYAVKAAGELFGEARLPTLVHADGNPHLPVTVELAPGEAEDAARERVLAESIRGQLHRLNSEFAHYAPAGYQLPAVTLRPGRRP